MTACMECQMLIYSSHLPQFFQFFIDVGIAIISKDLIFTPDFTFPWQNTQKYFPCLFK